MKEKMPTKLFIIPFLLSSAMIGVAVTLLLPVIAQQPQTYADIVIGWVSTQDLNRSGELRLLYCLLAASSAIVIIWHVIISKKKISCREKNYTRKDAIVFLVLIPCLTHFLYFSAVDAYLLLAAAFAATLAAFGLLTYRNILLLFVLYFSCLAVIAITIKPANITPASRTEVRLLCLTAFAFFVIMLTERTVCKKAGWVAIVLLQNIIPFLLLYFLKNTYTVKGEFQTILFDAGYRYSVWFALVAVMIYSLLCTYSILKKKPLGKASFGELILPTTILSIFVFNNVNGPLPIMRDWHHAAETFVPFHQVIDFGKTLFGDYISASGCFPMVYGFVQRFLLNNTVSSYYQAETLLGILSCSVSGILLAHAFGKKCALFIAVTIILPLGYTRILFLLPFLLILLVPGIISNRHLWLQIYVLCSMLLGMFYPLYGGAYLLGASPFALVQIWKLITAKQKVGKKLIICGWAATVAVVFLCSPLLLRLARHVFTMASQVTLAEGICLFDHEAPQNFLSWTNKPTINRILYFCTVYGLHILYVILPLSLCVSYIIHYKKEDKYQGVHFFAFVLCFIMIPAIYSYSLVRMDYGSFLFRSGAPLAAISAVMLGALWRYGGTFLSRKTILVCFSFLLTTHYLFVAMPRPHADKLSIPPALDASWQLAPKELQARFPRLGAVFLRESDIKHMNATQAKLEKIKNISAPILDIPGQLSYFLFNKEASVTGVHIIFRSTKAQQAAINIMKRDPPVCFSINSVYNYVTYRWMLDAGYAFSGGIAVPQKYAEQYPAGASPDYSAIGGYFDLGNMPNSMGKSISTLLPHFDEQRVESLTRMERKDKTYTLAVEFERDVYGKEVDFILFDFSVDNRPVHLTVKSFFSMDQRKKLYSNHNSQKQPAPLNVRVSWTSGDGNFDSKNSMLMSLGNGKLLVPLGANPWWLNGYARKLKVEIFGNLEDEESISLNSIKMLQFKATALSTRIEK
ncbi:MAG: hypothetical protein LBM00_06700 [Deltaproteobacteria bacterium]|jgi:hypothetical protein|nr:hypothetical protein [Deltaproteobacteria bacterium]